MVKEQYGLSNSDYVTSNCGSSSMVLDSRTDGNLCGSSDPDCDYGGRAGSWEISDCSMVAPELEEGLTMDEVLSDICSISVDGDYISGYLRFSLQGTS